MKIFEYCGAVILLAACCAVPASANNSSDLYTYGPLARTSQGYWIHTNIPSGCRWAGSDAAQKWSAASKLTFVWKGYTSAQSWVWNGSDNVQSTSNTIDTSVESGITDFANYTAQTEYRVKSGPDANGRYILNDADIIINYNHFSTDSWCSTSAPPSNMIDFPTLVLHEFGHVLGLAHDLDDTTNVTVMGTPQWPGQMKRT